MKKGLYQFIGSLLILLLGFSSLSWAHPGRTDSSGCHTCRTNCAKWGLRNGEYHCHRKRPRPIPKRSTPTSTSQSLLIKDIQSMLKKLEYDPGPVDGIYGKKTKSAIKAFQKDHKLTIDGSPSAELLKIISAQEIQPPKTFREIGKVVEIVDGDTIKVNIGGKIEIIRMIGMNTPEILDPHRPVQCFGKEASEQAKKLLQGKIVKIEKDDSQQNRDKYNRLLRYVWIDGKVLFNLKMIQEGYAFEYTYQIPYKYHQQFKQAQRKAKEQQRGLWHPNACAGEMKPIESQVEGPASKRKIIYKSSSLPDLGLDLEVTICLKFWVLPDGTIEEVIPLQRGDIHLERTAIEYLKSWHFAPVSPDKSKIWGIISIKL